MARKSKQLAGKKRGRPATGKDPLIALRVPEEMIKAIDNWAWKRMKVASRSAAIRRLLESGLKGRPK